MDKLITETVKLQKIITDFNLEVLNAPDNLNDVVLTQAAVNRPGLALSGFFDCFVTERVQVVGRMEHIYLEKMDPALRKERLKEFYLRKPVAVVIARGIEPFPEAVKYAKKYNVPLLRTKRSTSQFISRIIGSLSVDLAPKITRHGVLVEVYGEGILITGDSGIGKSETAIELIKRGHRLIADDAVEISRVSDITLVGRAPEIIKHYMELRGIGIIDIKRIYGTGAVKDSEKIELVVKFEPWIEGKMYDRMGIENEYQEILGIKIPSITIPVRPGRNLAVILEIAAMNFRLKKMGYNTAEEFNKKLEAEFLPK
ncbi:MAG: HPr(Ser) kinase/phosphatase [Clostridia bacterium]|nr:HPr(Ser) kinase/phosphatase [Clostridia bacterium]